MINNDYRTPPELVGGAAERLPHLRRSRWAGRPPGACATSSTSTATPPTATTATRYYGMFQPRLGFSWDVGGNAKTVVFGGWGKYYDRVILNDIFDEQYRQQFKIYSFCFSADGSPAPNCGVPALAVGPQFLLRPRGCAALVASGQAPGPEVFLVANDLKPPRSDQWTLGVRQQLGRWLGSLSYAGVARLQRPDVLLRRPAAGHRLRRPLRRQRAVPGYARVFITSTARRTWYDAIFLTLDQPYHRRRASGASTSPTPTPRPSRPAPTTRRGRRLRRLRLRLSSDALQVPRHQRRAPPGGGERHRRPALANFRVSSLITLGSGVPFTIFDDSTAPFTGALERGPAREEGLHHPGRLGLPQRRPAPGVAGAGDRRRGARQAHRPKASTSSTSTTAATSTSFMPRLPNVNPRFGQPNREFNTRRFQVGARVSF